MKKFFAVLTALILVLSLTSCSILFEQQPKVEEGTLGSGKDMNGTGGQGSLEVETTGGHGSIGSDELTGDILYGDALKTGKSDCIVFRFKDKVLMIDTAESSDYKTISTFLSEKNITRIDSLIITHFDNDHVGSAGAIIRNFEVVDIYMPNYIRISDEYTSMFAALNETGCKTKINKVTDNISLEMDGVCVTVNPTRLYDGIGDVTIDRDDESTDAEENNFSLITRVSYGSKSILLMGDAENERIAEYLDVCGDSDTVKCQADIIKLPHHGSYEANLSKLIARSGARYGIICAASSKEIDSRLGIAMNQAIVYKTYDGTVSFGTDGRIIKFM